MYFVALIRDWWRGGERSFVVPTQEYKEAGPEHIRVLLFVAPSAERSNWSLVFLCGGDHRWRNCCLISRRLIVRLGLICNGIEEVLVHVRILVEQENCRQLLSLWRLITEGCWRAARGWCWSMRMRNWVEVSFLFVIPWLNKYTRRDTIHEGRLIRSINAMQAEMLIRGTYTKGRTCSGCGCCFLEKGIILMCFGHVKWPIRLNCFVLAAVVSSRLLFV